MATPTESLRTKTILRYKAEAIAASVQLEPLPPAKPCPAPLALAWHEYREAFSRTFKQVELYDERIHGALQVSSDDDFYQRWLTYQQVAIDCAGHAASDADTIYADTEWNEGLQVIKTDMNRRRDLVALHMASFDKTVGINPDLWLLELQQLADAANKGAAEFMEYMFTAVQVQGPQSGGCYKCGCTSEWRDGERVCWCDTCTHGCSMNPFEDSDDEDEEEHFCTDRRCNDCCHACEPADDVVAGEKKPESTV
jgi:hypothetical protein